MTPDSARVSATFFASAFEYYVAGRFAVLAGLSPVPGNLMHHAIELGLKGALTLKGASLAELKPYGHNLPRLWYAFKAQHRAPSFDHFDEVVFKLQAFEDLRYPDAVLSQALQVELKNVKPGTGLALANTGERSSYELDLSDIDALMGEVLHAARQDAKSYTGRFHGAARQYLVDDNSVAELTAV